MYGRLRMLEGVAGGRYRREKGYRWLSYLRHSRYKTYKNKEASFHWLLTFIILSPELSCQCSRQAVFVYKSLGFFYLFQDKRILRTALHLFANTNAGIAVVLFLIKNRHISVGCSPKVLFIFGISNPRHRRFTPCQQTDITPVRLEQFPFFVNISPDVKPF